ncbi:MAG: hypothetical protein KJ737_11385 [Proteobacteria bacterium]|nr:hypothetical protein [Pseudomonadota bacterium]
MPERKHKNKRNHHGSIDRVNPDNPNNPSNPQAACLKRPNGIGVPSDNYNHLI